ncbi:hypothetical protein FAF44_50640 [Nonomuraea sp. MG754425]|uniref:hypothetical protein n=1 Tax=Nonomuraea sp. MG754425 TaxID=2570319 RepID=UPI001F284161|nr:hypothetical protein [Nonomuraea sp. MG754425]MCF6476537.1 hypothetical protein [Nonomuraea sp. MG754425]
MQSPSTQTNLFMSALYPAETRFSYLPRFAVDVRRRIAKAADRPELLRILAEQAEGGAPLASEEAARRALEARDLRAVLGVLRDERVSEEAVTEEGIVRDLHAVCEKGIGLLRADGFAGLDPPAIHVVDAFPGPFAGRSASAAALTVDRDDTAEYGIREGVYFIRERLTPTYSSFLLTHELIHHALGRSGGWHTAHGLEEGVCDLLGSVRLSQRLLGTALTRRLFILNRLSSGYHRLWERYLDGARQALAHLAVVGYPEFVRELAGGRPALHRIEAGLLDGISGRGALDPADAFTSLAVELLLLFPRAAVCGPAALRFAENALPGLTVREIGVRAGLTAELAARAAAELRDEHGLLYLRDDGIGVMDSEPALRYSRGWLRYDTTR